MKFNLFVAISIIALLSAWMVLGSSCSGPKTEEPSVEPVKENPIPTVRTRNSKAEAYVAKLTLRGKTEAARSSTLKAEIGGPILEISAKRGSFVSKGDVLVKIDPKSLPSQLAAAEALVAQRVLEHEAAKKLQSSGYQSETRLVESSANLAQARNQLSATKVAIENTVIRAPYDGVFNERMVDVGGFVGVGDPIATFLELDPMIVTAQATEQEIKHLEVGMKATIKIGDKEIDGTVRYLSQSADSAIRTYTIEVAFDNSQRTYQAGLTADVSISTQSELAHKVSPAILFLGANSDGDLGIKTVDANNSVVFYKAKIIGTDTDGVWISGLPEQAKIITVGQGFVKPGFEVIAIDESTIN